MNIYILRHGETKKNRVKSIKKRQSLQNLSDALSFQPSVAVPVQATVTVQGQETTDDKQYEELKNHKDLRISVDKKDSNTITTSADTPVFKSLAIDTPHGSTPHSAGETPGITLGVTPGATPGSTPHNVTPIGSIEEIHHIHSSVDKPTKITIEDAVDKDSVLNGNGYRQCEKTAEYIAQLELSYLLDLPQTFMTNLVISEREPDALIVTQGRTDRSISGITSVTQGVAQAIVHASVASQIDPGIDLIESKEDTESAPMYRRKIRIFASPVSRTIQSAEHIRYIITELLKEADMFVFDKHDIQFDVVIDQRLYDTDGDGEKCDINKTMQLKQFLNDLFLESQSKKKSENKDTSSGEHDDLLIVVTHNHIIELFYKMLDEQGVDGLQGGKKKFHNCSISKINMTGPLDTSEPATKRAEKNLTGEWDFVDHIDHMDLIKHHVVTSSSVLSMSSCDGFQDESSLDNSMIAKTESDLETERS